MEFLSPRSSSSEASGDTEPFPPSKSTDVGELFDDGEHDVGAEESDSEEQETKVEDEETKTEEDDRVRTGPIVYNGFYYAKYHESDKSTNYRCSSHKRTKCKAKVYHRADGTIIQKGEHKPGCNRDIVRDTPSERPPSAPVLTADILEAIDELALEQPTLSPQEVWDHIRKAFFQTPGRITSLSKHQVTGRFYRTKLKSFRNDVFVQIKTDPLCSLRENPSLKFFQYHGSYYEGEALHHFILWGHPALLDRLRARQTSLFIDGTFRCVPANFYQLVVVMVYDAISNRYIPSCYALTTGKTTKVYNYVLYHTNACCDFAMDPAFIACDFEQALRRKMLKLGITEREVDIAMEEGAMDELTTIRQFEIVRSGIRNVQCTIREECQDQGIAYSTEAWARFWKYFVRTWVKKYKPEDWNVYGVQEDIVNRTNSPLERYNRTLNRAMGVPHPDIGKFIVVLEAEAQRYVDALSDVVNRRVRTPRRVRPRLTSSAVETAEDSPSEVDDSVSTIIPSLLEIVMELPCN